MHDGLLFRHTRIARPEGRERPTAIPAFRRSCFEITNRLEMLAEPTSDSYIDVLRVFRAKATLGT